MRIAGFAQMHNELQNGHLHNWLKCMSVCDSLFIYDQASTDGSLEEYRHPNLHVIKSQTNDFSNELLCKQKLLELVLKESGADWIFWLDGDTLLDRRLLEPGALHALCEAEGRAGCGALKFGHYNLWRSDIYYRTDDQYDGLDGHVWALWKVNPRLSFPRTNGLHGKQYPDRLGQSKRVPYSLIHRGFSTDEGIIRKYETYKARGQTGWALDRFLKEDGLIVEALPDILPSWFVVQDSQDPRTKKPLREIYDGRQNTSS